MVWTAYVLPSAAAFAVGMLAAYFNMTLSRAALKKDSVEGVMEINILRYLVDAAVLAAIFLVCRSLNISITAPLISGAAALSVGGILMLKGMTEKMRSQQSGTDGGE